MILPRKYSVGSNVSAKQVDATHYIRLHCDVEMCASEVPLQKVDCFGYISPAALGYYSLRYRRYSEPWWSDPEWATSLVKPYKVIQCEHKEMLTIVKDLCVGWLSFQLLSLSHSLLSFLFPSHFPRAPKLWACADCIFPWENFEENNKSSIDYKNKTHPQETTLYIPRACFFKIANTAWTLPERCLRISLAVLWNVADRHSFWPLYSSVEGPQQL